jgi:hypothetical protein
MNLPSGPQTGFLVSDVETLFPELIKSIQHPASRPESVEAGLEKYHDAVDFKGINYQGLIPHIIRAIQEQQVMIEENQKIKAENSYLKSEIELLKSRLDALEKK